MGKVIPIRVNGKHVEKSEGLKKSATDYLANELSEIIEELEQHPNGSFLMTIEVTGYPTGLIDRIRKLLDA